MWLSCQSFHKVSLFRKISWVHLSRLVQPVAQMMLRPVIERSPLTNCNSCTDRGWQAMFSCISIFQFWQTWFTLKPPLSLYMPLPASLLSILNPFVPFLSLCHLCLDHLDHMDCPFCIFLFSSSFLDPLRMHMLSFFHFSLEWFAENQCCPLPFPLYWRLLLVSPTLGFLSDFALFGWAFVKKHQFWSSCPIQTWDPVLVTRSPLSEKSAGAVASLF